MSRDSGKSWTPLIRDAPVTLVEITPDGILFAYVIGRGLVRANEAAVQFETLGSEIGGGFLIHLAVDPANQNRLFAATGRGQILGSTDQGRTWAAFAGFVAR